MRTEVPPTAGLPLHWRDLWPVRTPQRLAAQLALPDALLTCSGTAALVIALRTLAAASRRRQVLVAAYTCPLVALAVAHCGLQLVLCDLLPDAIEPDPAQLAQRCGNDTLAIVATHLGGRLTDLAPLRHAAAACGAVLIEDAAQALGGVHADGRPAGLGGDIGVCSLAVGKGPTLYEGGLLMSPHAPLQRSLAAMAARLGQRDWRWELQRSLQLLGYAALYRPRALRWAYGAPLRRALRRGDRVGAAGDHFDAAIPQHAVGAWREAVGVRASARWPAFLAQARAQGQRRAACLAAIAGLRVVADSAGAQGSWPALLVLLPDAAARERALEQLWPRGLGVGLLFVHALPDYAYLRDIVDPAPMPQARDFAARCLSISNSPWLDEEGFEAIVAVLRRVCTESGR
ncbi:DegT/DnrJ/EryC1/StrS family aminotransferase [Xanthomonas translucens]|uniref:DegT/DnrJ/EryC1/StrS family aminotransferase n=5 Tax=Xanthomonas campestris pv. translucens TaxID=343 RepID=UPI00064201BF|nr:DegT/DnrJ/EryC1/StrS family aminotransferase [Xanthomonas translucens]AKK67999.1 nucleotide sugar aminotransferase [Xanthomonas translucens pv. undulosa]MCT8270027.1 DegT/DnrJ/EryC1/StrS family aminotransferase [Xanthomonas translucens pv. undulosa]WLA07080.1 DegT/DnrJ/EryC1/StrS family aminotransferase [Xanthomonas translucens]WNJ30987.1 DegT/DnrJ/EryC1/StrS family aminotransferase [Xanthomonas translucens pv. undulosa]